MEPLSSLLRHAQAMVGEGRCLRLPPGGVLITEGDEDDTIFLLIEGELVVSRILGTEATILSTIDNPGSVVGEMVSLGESVRTATVTARQASELIALKPAEFEEVLAANPQLATEFTGLTTRRAEDDELAELLASHLGLANDDALERVIASVTWHRLSRGDVLFKEGDSSDAIYFVVRGRLLVTGLDPAEGADKRVGEIGQGEVVGETGLLRQAPRNATVTALRETALASLTESDFYDLVQRRPRVMIEVSKRILDRGDRARTSPGSILAVVIAGPLNPESIFQGLQAGLDRFGKVERLGAAKVDSVLGLTGISESSPGEIGDVRVSRILHDAEMEADHLLLEIGASNGQWSRRCLEMADRVLIFVPAGPSKDDEAMIDGVLGRCPSGLRRILIRAHPPASPPPTGSEAWANRFAADEVLHVVEGSLTDLARVSRVAAGRGYALVLGGGGGRGFAHIGAYRALLELGVPIDVVGGTSIGGILGSVIADAMPVDALVAWASRHFPNAMDYTIPLVSLIKAGRITRSGEQTFGDRRIEDLWRTFFCVSTDLTASRPFVHRRGPLTRAMRATSAIPGIMPPVPEGDRLLIDGGVLNNLPIDVARDISPAGKVIAIDVAPPRGPGAHGDYGLSVSGWAALSSRLSPRSTSYPGIAAVLMRAMIIASMRERDSQVASGLADCYLDLDMRGVSILDFGDPASVAQRGYDAAMPVLEDWLSGE